MKIYKAYRLKKEVASDIDLLATKFKLSKGDLIEFAVNLLKTKLWLLSYAKTGKILCNNYV